MCNVLGSPTHEGWASALVRPNLEYISYTLGPLDCELPWSTWTCTTKGLRFLRFVCFVLGISHLAHNH